MEVQTSLADEIDSMPSDSSTLYDDAIKRILAYIPVLARILQGCVPEFKDIEIDEIEKLIEPKNIKVSQNCSKIDGKATDDVSVQGQVILYDVVFDAFVPTINDSTKIIVNIEAQNNFYPGYALERRAAYYCCRLIASQKGREFEHSNFDDIKKVYSIWICTSPPAYCQNTITAYRLEPINVFGNAPTNPSKYDVLEFVVVCLSDDFENVGNETVEFLNVLLSTKLAAIKKKAILENQFNIKITEKFGKEINEMCNLSAGIREDGVRETRAKNIASIMRKINYSFDAAVNLLDIPVEEHEDYRTLVNKYLRDSKDNLKS